jgi:hypothetical protein
VSHISVARASNLAAREWIQSLIARPVFFSCVLLSITEIYPKHGSIASLFFQKNGRSAGEAPGFQRKRNEGDSGAEGRKIRSRSESAAGAAPVRMGGKVATVRIVTGEQGEHIFGAAARPKSGGEPVMTNAEKVARAPNEHSFT